MTVTNVAQPAEFRNSIQSSRHSEICFDEIKITDTASEITPVRMIKMDSLVRGHPDIEVEDTEHEGTPIHFDTRSSKT